MALEPKSVNFQRFHFAFTPSSSRQLHGHQDVGGSSFKSYPDRILWHWSQETHPPLHCISSSSQFFERLRDLIFRVLALEKRSSNMAVHLYILGGIKMVHFLGNYTRTY